MPHITLVPPTNVHVEDADACLEVLRHAAAKVSPFSSQVGPVETFAPVNPVVYLKVGVSQEIVRLRDAASNGPLAYEPDYEFVPHVTLSEGASDEQIAAMMTAYAGYVTEVTFDRIHLLQKDSGEAWKPIADLSLGGERDIGTGGLVVSVATASIVNAEIESFLQREWKPWLNTNLGPDRIEFEPVVIIARREGEIVGVLRAEFRPPAGHLRELLIGAEARGQGIARFLLDELDLQARKHNVTRLTTNFLHGCEAEGYLRHVGWNDDTESIVVEFDREMVRLAKPL